jgi:beta-aspartyl-peptidase (threonine type)
MPSARRTPPVALALHGGAGPQSEEAARERLDGLLPAVEAGWEVLISGGGALEAAVAAVVVLEDDPRFNAGLGSALTREGTIEMDALVMEGPERRAGAVAAVRRSGCWRRAST